MGARHFIQRAPGSECRLDVRKYAQLLTERPGGGSASSRLVALPLDEPGSLGWGLTTLYLKSSPFQELLV